MALPACAFAIARGRPSGQSSEGKARREAAKPDLPGPSSARENRECAQGTRAQPGAVLRMGGPHAGICCVCNAVNIPAEE